MTQASQSSSLADRFGITKVRFPDGELEVRLRGLVRFYRAALRQLRNRGRWPLRTRLKALRKGFTAGVWNLYGLDYNDPELYLNDLTSRLRLFRINGLHNPIINNKLIFTRLASDLGIPHPELIATIHDGRLYPAAGNIGENMEETLSRTLERFPRQIYRPTWAGGGQGMFLLAKEDGLLTVNGHETRMEQVIELLQGLDRYLATECVVQAEYAHKIFPGSVNTLRVLTLWDYQCDAPFTSAICQRFGNPSTAPMDNWHGGLGGVNASVERNRSCLGKGIVMNSRRELIWVSSHPDTKQAIEGVAIPHLERSIEGIERAAASFPFCPLVGWDVAMTADGYSVLEANPLPSFRVWQAHEGLFNDARTRQFFRHWGLYRAPR